MSVTRAVTLFVLLICVTSSASAQEAAYDVVIYGGSSGGVAAAVQARRMGKSVVLIEASSHLGGLTSGGLGATDIGNKAAIGGISRDFYRRVKQHYSDPSAWVHQQAQEYRSARQQPGEDTMWTFEPHVAEKIMNDLVKEAGVEVILEQRLDLRQGVEKENKRIVSIMMEGGRRFRGKQFIDATYEGDLMALAGVSYTVGREANSAYGETLNGVQTNNAVKHQLQPGVDPYVKAGDPASGLLPGVHPGPPGEEGDGDKRVQAYCFRMCLTDAPENRMPFEKPEGYNELRYELLFRNFEAGEDRVPWSPTPMPNRKTDTNNNYGFSTDNINMNYDWADGDYATRQQIFQEHLDYQRGLMWTLANHPRVPEHIRQEVSGWGNCRDEFPEHDGWSYQLYVREARRMISDYVMTQNDCQRKQTAEDPVGLGAYNMDSHNVQRYVDEHGHARNEGDIQVGVPPYPISYRSIVPKQSECENLGVPVCLAASHIAYGSIRMEPVFMVLGQSAATAACQAIDQQVALQQIDYEQLRRRLLDDGQVLQWTGSRGAPVGIDAQNLPGLVLEAEQAQRVGTWSASSSQPGFVGTQYWHDDNEGKGDKLVTFEFEVRAPGTFEIRLAYSPHENRATNVPVTVQHAGGRKTLQVNQRQQPMFDKAFTSLGTFSFAPEKPARIIVSNADTDGHVIVDAVQLIPQ